MRPVWQPAPVTVLATLHTSDSRVTLRRAVRDDVPVIVDLLLDDPLGMAREGTDAAGMAAYVRAFEAVDADPAHLLVVAEDGGRVVATLQLSFIPGLARRGALRAQVEGVRVHPDKRNSGLGRALLLWARDEAERRGCALIQLTSDKQRADAHRFYTRLGYVAVARGLQARAATVSAPCTGAQPARDGSGCSASTSTVPGSTRSLRPRRVRKTASATAPTTAYSRPSRTLKAIPIGAGDHGEEERVAEGVERGVPHGGERPGAACCDASSWSTTSWKPALPRIPMTSGMSPVRISGRCHRIRMDASTPNAPSSRAVAAGPERRTRSTRPPRPARPSAASPRRSPGLGPAAELGGVGNGAPRRWFTSHDRHVQQGRPAERDGVQPGRGSPAAQRAAPREERLSALARRDHEGCQHRTEGHVLGIAADADAAQP